MKNFSLQQITYKLHRAPFGMQVSLFIKWNSLWVAKMYATTNNYVLLLLVVCTTQILVAHTKHTFRRLINLSKSSWTFISVSMAAIRDLSWLSFFSSCILRFLSSSSISVIIFWTFFLASIAAGLKGGNSSTPVGK